MSFRRGVAAILQNRSGRILICERSGTPGAWQFPQGGMEANESRREALAREVTEEIGVEPAAYEIIGRKGPHRYRFAGGAKRKGYVGQTHHYFLLQLIGRKSVVNLKRAGREFRSTRWIKPAEFQLAWLPPMKRAVYARVLRKFFGVKLR